MLLLLAMLSCSTMFFEGCTKKNTELTMGFVPMARGTFTDAGWRGCTNFKTYPLGIVLQICFFIGFGIAIAKMKSETAIAKIADFLSRPRFVASFALVVVVRIPINQPPNSMRSLIFDFPK